VIFTHKKAKDSIVQRSIDSSPPKAMPPPEQQQQVDDDDDFTFPALLHLPSCSPSPRSSPPVWLSPIRRSFSAASPLRRYGGGGWSPALSDYAGFFCDAEEEERMDSLWEDLNDEDDPSHDVSRRRSVAGAASEEKELGAGASRSSRRLLVMMRALKNMFVAHKGKSRVHKVR
jgi:hypothetical protein